MENKYRYEAKKYPVQIESKFVSTNAELIANSYQYKFSKVAISEYALTPKYASEHDCFIFTFLIARHVINENDAKLADISVRYSYRLDLKELTPTTDELFDMLDESTDRFANYFYDQIKKTTLPKNIIKKLDPNKYKPLLESLIAHWEEKLRHLKVDKDGNFI